MAKFFALFGILVWASCNIAAACPSAPTQASIASLPPLIMGSGTGGQLYYCMASAQASTVGDLSPAEWAKRAQICNTSCDYMPMIPGDAHSLLVPVNCGPGWHDTPFLVEPPPAPKAPAGLKMTTPGCNAIVPSKAPPAPAASPKP
jgi:hypothetical protein